MGGEHWTLEWVTASIWVVWGVIWATSIYNLWQTHLLLKEAKRCLEDAEDFLASVETGEGGGGNDEIR